ncbi:MAG: TSUP family transporter, partial [Acidilobaceae archaeon]
LISVLGLPVHEAVAASMLSIVITSTSGSVVHIANGNVVFNIAIPFALGAVIGAQIGSAVASRMRSKTLTIVVGLVLVTVGVLTLLR